MYGKCEMQQKIIRVVTHDGDGSFRTMEYDSFDSLDRSHDRVGIDDCSTDLSLRGMPVYRGLVGPIPESKTVVRYESPDVFEMLTKEWAAKKNKRRRRRSTAVPAPLAMGIDPATITATSQV